MMPRVLPQSDSPLLNSNKSLSLCVFLLVCFQAALLKPYLVLVPGDRVNLFTSALALLPMSLLWREFLSPYGRSFWPSWLALGLGLAVSASLSPAPVSSLARAFAFWAPSMAGLYCANRLLRTSDSLRVLFLFLTLCFAVVTAMNFILGRPPEFLGLHHHALTGILVLLSAGPLYFLFKCSGVWRCMAGLLLCLGYALCFLAGSRFLVLLPLILVPFLAFIRRLRPLWTLVGTLLTLCLIVLFFAVNPGKSLRFSNYESTSYRLEGFAASWEIMEQHPLAGIGIRTSRVELLKDFQPVFGTADREFFLAVLQRNVTSDNQYLSLPVGVGIPLAFLYFVLIGRLLWRFGQRVCHREMDRPTELALLIPLLATLAHLAIYDGLFYPHICWYFHVLLGVAVYCGTDMVSSTAPETSRRSCISS